MDTMPQPKKNRTTRVAVTQEQAFRVGVRIAVVCSALCACAFALGAWLF